MMTALLATACSSAVADVASSMTPSDTAAATSPSTSAPPVSSDTTIRPARYRQAEVRVVGGSVQISVDGNLVRTHAVRHDRAKEHGAFANPGGRPRRSNAAT